MNKLILIALNEFNLGFFTHASNIAHLPNIKRMLSMNHSRTWTDDAVERKGLDPWVQWVSIHTGTPSKTHRIRHLGDIPKLITPQVWEKLSTQGVSSGIWGAMNATKGKANRCRFFLPDPWTFSERAYPEELNDLLDLPRYYSRNYLEVDKWVLAKSLGKLLTFLLPKPSLIWSLLKITPFALKGIFKFGITNHLLFSIFDLVSVTTFLYYKKSKKPSFSLVFLNSIAHMQHNIWCKEGTLDDKCLYSLEAVDKSIGLLQKALDTDEAIVIMNALNQKNIATEKNDILYRQISPSRFLTTVGINHNSVEQLMTNDGHIIFDSVEDALSAAAKLAESTINGYKIFDVEYDPVSPKKLFFQLEYWQELQQDAVFLLGGKSYSFFTHFETVVMRTGEHLQSGDVFSAGINLPPSLYNHEVQHHILHYYNIKVDKQSAAVPGTTIAQAQTESPSTVRSPI